MRVSQVSEEGRDIDTLRAGGVGRGLSDLIRGNVVGHDLSRFRLSRFSDGSPIRLGAAL